jgi:hypothetical protein
MQFWLLQDENQKRGFCFTPKISVDSLFKQNMQRIPRPQFGQQIPDGPTNWSNGPCATLHGSEMEHIPGVAFETTIQS